MAISLNPDNAVKTGLFGSNGPELASITGAQFLEYDWEGKFATSSICLQINLTTADGVEMRPNYYSVGALDKWLVVNNGHGIESKTGKAEGLDTKSNAHMFIMSLVEGGFDKSFIGDDIAVIIGTQALFQQRPKKGFQGAADTAPASGEPKKEKTVLLVAKGGVKTLPNGVKAAPAVHAGNGKATAEQTATAVNIDTLASELVVTVLKANGGKLAIGADPKTTIGTKVLLQATKGKLDKATKDAVIKRVVSTEFLGGSDAWAFDDANGELLLA
jgi:hypothetical protein